MNRIAVNEDVLRWAIERSGLKLHGLERKFPKLQGWRTGKPLPTMRQLEAFAKATMTPFGYFFLPEPPEDKLPIPDFRTMADLPVQRPSPNLMETVQYMQRRQDWMREFLIEEGQEPLPFVRSATMRDDPIQVARRLRKTLGIDQGWARQQPSWTAALRALRVAIENVGALVVTNGIVGNNTRRKLEPKEFRGFILIDEYAPLVFVNGSDGKAAQMFTLAHELAHIWIGESGVFNLVALQPADFTVERFCNRVAAEFLVPADELRPLWASVGRADEPFQEIARHFKVSALVAARRALDLGLIRKTAFFAFYDQYLKDERRKAKTSSGGDFYATQDVRIGRRFGAALVQAAREGRLLYRDAYALSGLRGQTFDRYAKALGFRVTE